MTPVDELRHHLQSTDEPVLRIFHILGFLCSPMGSRR